MEVLLYLLNSLNCKSLQKQNKKEIHLEVYPDTCPSYRCKTNELSLSIVRFLNPHK